MISLKRFACMWLSAVIVLLLAGHALPESKRLPEKDAHFSFTVTADMRRFAGPSYQSSRYFMGACEAVRDFGKGAFMVSVGDIDPPADVHNTVGRILGKEYTWYPVVGNHEAETPDDMAWLRDWGRKEIPNLVRRGPRNCEGTTYSFDVGSAHLVVVNLYYDGKSDSGADGDVCESLYEWLKNDLESSSKRFTFVFGHEPIISIPDMDNGRYKPHKGLWKAHPERCHCFQQLLLKHRITAYICGDTHNTSVVKINGLWQLDAGHCRGIGDKGARSTFFKVRVGENRCRVEVYRDDGNGGPYSLTRTILLD